MGSPSLNETTTEINVNGYPLPHQWRTNIILIWSGQALSVLATFAASFAAIWFITETTSSAMWLSLTAAASLLPIAVLSPFGGVVADRCNRKHVMMLADGCAGLFSLILALIVANGFLNVGLIILLLTVRATAQAFHSPALSALMPHLVPERHLVRINSMDQSITSIASIAGPAAGILLYTLVGLPGVMLLDALFAALACILLAQARIPKTARATNNIKKHATTTSTTTTTGKNPVFSASAKESRSSVIADLREGVSLVLQDKGIRNLTLMVMITMLLIMPSASLSPLMIYQNFGGDGWMASLIEGIFGLGLLVGSAIILIWGGGSKHTRIIVLSGIVFGLAFASCGLLKSNQFLLYAIFIGIAAAALGCYNSPILPIFQKRIPDDKLGRVMGIFLTGSSLAAPIGLMFSGFFAEALGITTWFAICGSLTILCCAAGWLNKDIRNLDAISAPSEEQTESVKGSSECAPLKSELSSSD